jgi:hypothetical protein
MNARNLFPLFLAIFPVALSAQFPGWAHSGSMYILTTPEGAGLEEGAVVKDFPLLVRLNPDHFPFSEAAIDGRDIRFSSGGNPLSHEIEEWDREAGQASIWVRIPEIQGNRQQELKLHWGNPQAQDASDGKSVFNNGNGYCGVWHMAPGTLDSTGQLDSKDTGTQASRGMVGPARYFPGGKGIFCGTEIQGLPSGQESHSTQLWFRSEVANAEMLGWGVEKGQGKVHVKYASPSIVRFDCYFSNGNASAGIPGDRRGWHHAAHTYEDGQSTLYIDGEKCAEGNPRHTPMYIPSPARMWIGGWYNRYSFVGEMDEVRVSSVARPEAWVRLEYENQKAGQTLVGHLVQDCGVPLVKPAKVAVQEGGAVQLFAEPGGARKVFWVEIRDGKETVLATDRFKVEYNPGRISGDKTFQIRLDTVFSDGLRPILVPVEVKESLPDPEFELPAPRSWHGRTELVLRPTVLNHAAMEKAGLPPPVFNWKVSGIATLNRKEPGQLVLERAQGNGRLHVQLSLSNGGESVTKSVSIRTQQEAPDTWVPYPPQENELPMEGQFYARDNQGKGSLYCRGKMPAKADEVFLRVLADGKPYAEESQSAANGQDYTFEVRLDPGLVKYHIELGTRATGKETVIHRAGEILCGDAYLIDGQSNALATDTRETSPKVTNEWVRSYGRPRHFKEGERENLWCKPVWKAGQEDLAELGWWGMDLANRLVESEKVPVFIVNGAVGGTRIDQHQRNDSDSTDLDTIYGRMLWRVQQARLTHGIRAIIWHQGENDQGAAGPDGGYGWETYQEYFVEMSADWKRDFPNFRQIYLFQIWPNACAMGGQEGNGDMLRERQRTLPFLYDNMTILSSLGIRPPGGCHYPLEGWSQFAGMLHPLILREVHGKLQNPDLSAPNLLRIESNAPGSLTLVFDKEVVWDDQLANQFYLNGKEGLVKRGHGEGDKVTLAFPPDEKPGYLTYLRERSWNHDNLLRGKNGIAALTFCKVAISPSK